MRRTDFLHTILKRILEGMDFTISFDDSTDNGDGTHTMNGVCDFKFIYPGQYVTIDSNLYTVTAYDTTEETITVKARGASPAITATSFTLRTPFFCHGHPIAAENELTKIPKTHVKVPMLYLMEPCNIVKEKDPLSAFSHHADFTLCVLTEAKVNDLLTDDLYYHAIRPMENLAEDFREALEESNLFYNDGIGWAPTHHTKFGINIKETGTKKLYFSEKLSGLAIDIHLDIDKQAECDDCSDAPTQPSPCPECPGFGEELYNGDNVTVVDQNGAGISQGSWQWAKSVVDGQDRWTYAGNPTEGQVLKLFIEGSATAPGKYYLLSFDIVSEVDGFPEPGLIVSTDTDYFPLIYTSFSYSRVIQASIAADAYLYLNTLVLAEGAVSGWLGHIQNISIKEIPTNYNP